MMGRVIHQTWLLVLLAVLATARLTRLINDDAILDRPRAWVQRGGESKLAYFVTCPWCVSIWVGACVAVATYDWHAYGVVQVGLLMLAASHVTGMLAVITVRVEDS